MNNYITAELIMKRFNENGIKYSRIELSSGWFVIVCEYGGHIFGPFDSNKSDSIFWASRAFEDADEFAKMIADRDWNLGGDRFWLEPELPFFIENREDFFGSYMVQESLDPGTYSMEEIDYGIKMSQSLKLKSFEKNSCLKEVYMQREIAPVKNPFVYKDLSHVDAFAFKERLKIEDKGGAENIYLEPWILTQVNPCGKLIIPHVGNELDVVNYYEDIPESMIINGERYTWVDVTGNIRYKLGFKALQITGRSGFIGKMKDGRTYLIVKSFFNNPSNVYSGAPNSNENQYGCSLFVYNDSGSQGGFAEYETCGTTISGDTGLKCAEDEIYYYFFVGDEEVINKIAKKLL